MRSRAPLYDFFYYINVVVLWFTSITLMLFALYKVVTTYVDVMAAKRLSEAVTAKVKGAEAGGLSNKDVAEKKETSPLKVADVSDASVISVIGRKDEDDPFDGIEEL